jgi:hypothetical protein
MRGFKDASIADVTHGAVYICGSFCFSELHGMPEFREPRNLDDVLLHPAFGESLFINGRDDEKIRLNGNVREHIAKFVFVRAKIEKTEKGDKLLILEPAGMKPPEGWRSGWIPPPLRSK